MVRGAFTVNRLGLSGAPFPLTSGVRSAGGRWTVTATRAAELADLLAGAAMGAVVVLDVATDGFLDPDDEHYVRQWPASRIAAEQGVACAVHDFDGLTRGVAGLGAEALVMRPDDLLAFLAGWSPQELTLAGVSGAVDGERLAGIAPAAGIVVGAAQRSGAAEAFDAVLPLSAADPTATRPSDVAQPFDTTNPSTRPKPQTPRSPRTPLGPLRRPALQCRPVP